MRLKVLEIFEGVFDLMEKFVQNYASFWIMKLVCLAFGFGHIYCSMFIKSFPHLRHDVH